MANNPDDIVRNCLRPVRGALTDEQYQDVCVRIHNAIHSTGRFFLAQDDDCHWYVVPSDRQAEWDAWRAIPTDDERSWTPPDFARQVGGSPTLVTFTDPVIA